VEAGRASTAGKEPSGHVILTSTGVPAARHRYDARVTGCGSTNIEVMGWVHEVHSPPDGSIRLTLTSTATPGCRIVATIPAAPVPGIEGSPIGTAGAAGQKTPGIEGSPIGTAGAPRGPGTGGRTGSADREIERLIAKATTVLPQLACADGPQDLQSQLAPLQAALRQVAGAKSAASTVAPLRRFDAARQALYKPLAGNRAHAAGANRCADAERRCAATGFVGDGCGIDAAVCLARVLCTTRP
jgi:hypothetical protein